MTCSFFTASDIGNRADGREIKRSTFAPPRDIASLACLGLLGAAKSTSPSLKATPTSSPACGGAILRAGDAKQSPLKRRSLTVRAFAPTTAQENPGCAVTRAGAQGIIGTLSNGSFIKFSDLRQP